MTNTMPHSTLKSITGKLKNHIATKQTLFVLALLAYLGFESSFHAILTSTVIDPSSNMGDIHRVEIYGRLISGFGSGLLFTKLLVSILSNKLRKPISWSGQSVTFLLVFSTVYFGQKAAIERLLIEPSSAEVRRDAVLVNTVKKGLYNQDLASKSFSFSESVDEQIEQKVMLSLLSAGFLYNQDFKQGAMDQLQSILLSIASNSYNVIFYSDILPTFYRSKQDIEQAFSQYAEAHKERDRNLRHFVIDDKWRELYEQASTEYVRKDVEAQVEKAGYSLRNRRVKREYEANVERSLVELRRYLTTNGRSALTRGSAKRFIEQARNRYSDLNRSMQKEMDLPKGSFQLYPAAKAHAWLEHLTIIEFEKTLRNQLSDVGIKSMKPNIRRFSTFERHADIQKKAKAAMGDYYVTGFSFNWGDAELYAALRDAFIETEVDHMNDNIKGQLSSFEDGGELETIGKNALRAILIPCIALVLSVVLSVFSVVKLLSMVLVRGPIQGGGEAPISKGIKAVYRAKLNGFMVQRAFALESKFILNTLILLAIVLLVLNAPRLLGWHAEVLPMVPANTSIAINFVNAVSPSVEVLLNLLDNYLYWLLGWAVLIRLTEFGFAHKASSFDGWPWANRDLLLRTSIKTIWFAALMFVPIFYLLGQPSDTQAAVIAYGTYKWLLSVQPVVYLQGQFLNDIAHLPHLVDSISAPLKAFDSYFWPE
ncbi:hypothetical protein [Salinivibrio sp. PR932]|uniref:hypothetical protein n=1 Tax=Salinivibrio sp. PR932 TaxID=1909492 RepID=UPI0010558FF1|nr:hypothetical protein [Salinivibrio sp. PR932]